MTQSYDSPEIRDAAIDSLKRLQDIVGYHFPWCERTPQPCSCGMDLMRQAKAKLSDERLEEYSLWAEALEIELNRAARG